MRGKDPVSASNRKLESMPDPSRRRFLQSAGAGTLTASLQRFAPAYAWANALGQAPKGAEPDAIDLVIKKEKISIGGKEASATLINGTIPGPVLRFREGQKVTVRLTNHLQETTSIHWHGVLVPFEMDGAPGVSFPGVRPGETFTYRYTLRQSGTYWYHSHSAMQEQTGVFGPYIIDPAGDEPVKYDREYVVMLSDWTFNDPMSVLGKLKKQGDYFNFQRRTVPDFFRDLSRKGWGATWSDRLMWARERMDPTDILDVTGYTYTYLVNGLAPESNWTALFTRGERVRLRFINSSAMTIFDVRIPGLKMSVFQADGQNVESIDVDEFRIGVAETYDVIVQPTEEMAYTIFAEAMDRSGYAAGTLASRSGMRADLPARRKRPLRTMADMGMANSHGMPGMSAGNATGQEHQGVPMPQGKTSAQDHQNMPGMKMPPGKTGGQEHQNMPGMQTPAGKEDPQKPAMARMNMPGMQMTMHGPNSHGPGNSMVAMMPKNRLNEPGVGLGDSERRVLVYTDLRRLVVTETPGDPERGIELHLTGNMERQIWGFNGKKFSEAPESIPLPYNRWFRITLVNDTMMDHPMHIHGMFMLIENGAGERLPYKHTILVKGGEKMSFLVKPDEPGPFAFHCHLLFHMELGMFRVVSVPNGQAVSSK